MKKKKFSELKIEWYTSAQTNVSTDRDDVDVRRKKEAWKKWKKVVWHKYQSDVKTQWKAATQRHRQTDETKI